MKTKVLILIALLISLTVPSSFASQETRAELCERLRNDMYFLQDLASDVARDIDHYKLERRARQIAISFLMSLKPIPYKDLRKVILELDGIRSTINMLQEELDDLDKGIRAIDLDIKRNCTSFNF